MKEKDPLLPKHHGSFWFGTQFRVSIFAFIVGCAMQLKDITETQFVYAYWEKRTKLNTTSYDFFSNHTANDEKCHNNSTKKNDDSVQHQATMWAWYITIVTYGTGLPGIILVGPMSDRMGRKLFLLLNTGFTVLSYIARTYVVCENLNLYWYLLTCAIEGVAGSHYAFHLLSGSILTDSTSSGSNRPMAFAVYETMFGVGAGGSQLLAGYLIKSKGFLYPYIISSGMFFTVFMLILSILNVGHDNKKQTSKYSDISSQTCLIFGNKQALQTKYNRKDFFTCLLVFFLHHLPLAALSSLRTIYVLGTPFCWTSVHIGWYGAGSDIVQYILCTLILKCLLQFMNDVRITTVGFMSSVVSFALYGAWQFDWIIYTATAVGILRNVPIPMFKAILSRMVTPEYTGSLFSAIYLAELISRLGGATLFNNIYTETRPIYKGMVFLIMAALLLLDMFMFLYLYDGQLKEVQNEIVVESAHTSIQDPSTTDANKRMETKHKININST